MKFSKRTKERFYKCTAIVLCMVFIVPVQVFADAKTLSLMADSIPTDSIPAEIPVARQLPDDRMKVVLDEDEVTLIPADSLIRIDDIMTDTVDLAATDSISAELLAQRIKARNDSIRKDSLERAAYGEIKVFNPNPTRAVWLSALFPGLGQIYNRRYWKLPIIAGGYVGLAYATSWNNQMLKDYTRAYGDITDNDPNTKSYMDFYPSTIREEDLDMDWLENTLRSRKDFYRRNRDLCIICMVGLYLVCIIDAYVDASLANFDISPNLSIKLKPAAIGQPQTSNLPSLGGAVSFEF